MEHRHSLLICIVLITVAVKAEEEKGPFDIDDVSIDKCDDNGEGEVTVNNLVVKMKAKNMVDVTFEATNKFPFDDSTSTNIEVSPYDEGQKKFGPVSLRVPLGDSCKAFQIYFPKSYKQFFAHLGIEGCPVQPKTWSVKDYTFEFNVPFSNLPYKRYQADIIFKREGKTSFCVRTLFTAKPEGTVKYGA